MKTIKLGKKISDIPFTHIKPGMRMAIVRYCLPDETVEIGCDKVALATVISAENTFNRVDIPGDGGDVVYSDRDDIVMFKVDGSRIYSKKHLNMKDYHYVE